MAQQTPVSKLFEYRNIELYKSQSLGSGSYGGVCKARCDGLLCAAKIMHSTLFDLRDPGTTSYLQKFQEECHLLSMARHPNVVQYLSTFTDPDTRLPVLLMELCEESLTSFLERSPRHLSCHTELNICHDISLALVYLHSNGLIHRDLTGNNVLMVAGPRAKITDFGMSKLATVNPRMTALTLCPGNVLYMSPEALDDASTYTTKLDVFSFGVLLIQILTGKFPSPLNRFRTIHDPKYNGEVRVLVSDFERRQSHLSLIPVAHPLKPLALQCLQRNEGDRPSALQLSEKLQELKASPQYTESMHRPQSSDETCRCSASESSHEKHQNMTPQGQLDTQKLLKQKDSIISSLQDTISGQQNVIQELKEVNKSIKAKMSQEAIIEAPQMHVPTEASKEVTLKSPSKGRENTIIMGAAGGHGEGVIVNKEQPQEIRKAPQMHMPAEASKEVKSESHWKEGKNAPETMKRGAAIVHGNIAYFAPAHSGRVYSYQDCDGQEQWSLLPENPVRDFGLSVIDNLVTSVGGFSSGPTNTLLSLTGEGENRRWSSVFPPMPTLRTLVTCITTKHALVVAGGFALPEGSVDCLDGGLDTVEVMDVTTKKWASACPLPAKLSQFSGTACGDSLYLAGGITAGNTESRCVFTCRLSDLWKPRTLGSRIGQAIHGIGEKAKNMNVWKEIGRLPVPCATLAAFDGCLMAIYNLYVYKYDSNANIWSTISQLNRKRNEYCFAAIVPPRKLMIVGGYKSDSVEFLPEKDLSLLIES